jgi:ubiquinone biosynthesis protein
MVEERVYGVPISRVDIFKEKKVNMEKLAERGVEIFFTQVFDHSFFHADMHPGNVFVDISDPENPVYKAIDFGIVGTLDPESQAYLALGSAVPSAHQHTSFDSTTHGTPGIDTAAAG